MYIVMYHYIRDLQNTRYPNIKGLDIRLFKKQIAFFKERFNIVTMEQVIAASKGEYNLPSHAMLLTFDDGYIDHYTYAMPILEEVNIQGSFFITGQTVLEHKLLDVNKIHYILASTTVDKLLPDVLERMNFYRGKEFIYPTNEELFETHAKANRFDTKEVIFIKRMLQTVLPEEVRYLICTDLFKKYLGITETQLAYELYLNEDQIHTMKRHGMFIGIHGYDHYWLGHLPEQQMKQDIKKAIEVMNPFIDKNEWVMNYPYGSYNEKVIEYVKSQGACLGLTTKVAIANIEQNPLFELPRLDCNDFPPKSENYKEIK